MFILSQVVTTCVPATGALLTLMRVAGSAEPLYLCFLFFFNTGASKVLAATGHHQSLCLYP